MVSLAVVSPASAHHSAAASYEADHSIEIKGKVLEFAWTNPHAHLHIDVTQGPFKGHTYAVELGSPEALVNSGWTKTMLRPGDDVVVHVRPSRVGAPVGLCRNCTLTINGKVREAAGVAKLQRSVGSAAVWCSRDRICQLRDPA
jgi:uncharacterized protein DUF6152